MGRKPCCEKVGLKRGGWTAREDEILIAYIKANGEGKWRDLPARAGLKRCGKSCRLRWLNYLNPGIKRGNITPEEEDLILTLHKQLGNRWSVIAGRLPGRTDNEIKNYWNTILYKKVQDHHQQRMKVPIQQSLPSQENNTECKESGDKCMQDMDDNYLQFLFSGDINTLSWDEEIYDHQDISSEFALSYDDSMFDYWKENIFMEQNNAFELYSLDILSESQLWP